MTKTTAKKRSTVLVTGISGRLGRLLTQDLHRKHQVVGVDRRPFVEAPSDVTMHRVDIRSRRCEDVFRTHKIKAVVHMNIMHDPRQSDEDHHTFNVIGTQHLLEYCVRYNVPKLVMLSTANVYGPNPRNESYLTEDSLLMAGETDSSVRDLVAVDMLCTTFFWKHPEVETVVLRPVHICGSVHNAPSNYLRLPTIPTLLGFDPMVQLIHERDVVNALMATLRPGARGVFNVTGPEAVPLSAILSTLGKPVRPLPHVLFEPMVRTMYRSRVWGFPPRELDHIKYSCTVNGTRIHQELGYTSQYNLNDIVTMFQ
jgi:UDP-glucose 4-epimerase